MSWPGSGRGRFFARITIETDPHAAMEKPLRAWFQWQHVAWKASWEPLPAEAHQPVPA